MISLPIIFREFRAASRRKRTFVLRFVCAALLTCAVILLLLQEMLQASPSRGTTMLHVFGWQLFVLTFLIAPAFTCGCITEEKEEGTLGLLFLTHLNATEIVLGKVVGRGFDLLLLFVTAIPFLFIPILLGGVGWDQALCILFAIGSVLMLALTAGVFCSTYLRTTGPAAVAAYLCLILCALGPFWLSLLSPLRFPSPFGDGAEILLSTEWLRPASPVTALDSLLLYDSLIAFFSSLVISAGLLIMAVQRLPRALDEVPFRQRFPRLARSNFIPAARSGGTPRGARLVHDRNPVYWLQFSRSGRWNWTLQAIAAGCLFVWQAVAYYLWIHEVDDSERDLVESLYYGGVGLIWCIMVLVIVHASRLFVARKKDGSLELLLTTPVSNRQIVKGKLLAILSHYGLLFGMSCSLILSGGLAVREQIFGGLVLYEESILPDLACAISGVVYYACVSLLVSAWSRSMKQAIALSFLATIGFDLVLNGIVAVGIGLIELSQLNQFYERPYPDITVPWVGQVSRVELFTWCGAALHVFVELALSWLAYRLLVENLRVYAAR